MARYTGPSHRQSRRVGFSLTETGKDLKSVTLDEMNKLWEDSKKYD